MQRATSPAPITTIATKPFLVERADMSSPPMMGPAGGECSANAEDSTKRAQDSWIGRLTDERAERKGEIERGENLSGRRTRRCRRRDVQVVGCGRGDGRETNACVKETKSVFFRAARSYSTYRSKPRRR